MSISSIVHNLHSKAVGFWRNCLTPRQFYLGEAAALDAVILSSAAILARAVDYIPSWTSPFHGCLVIAGCVSAHLAYRHWILVPSIRKQIQKAVLASKGKTSSMLVIRGKENTSTDFISYSALDFFQKSSKNYSIDLITPNSQLPWDGNWIHKKYDRIDITAHGTNKSIEITSACKLSKDSKKEIQWIASHIKKGGVIALNCCSAAEGAENIARALSRSCPQVSVRGPEAAIDGDFCIDYSRDGIPNYSDGALCRKKNITRTYVNGTLVGSRRRK